MSFYVARLKRPYDYRVLIEAYIYTQHKRFLHSDFEVYYASLLEALQEQFGIRLSHEGLITVPQKVFWMLFQSTVRSLLQITNPWADFLDETLLVKKLLNFAKRSDMNGLLEQSAVFEECLSQVGAVADAAGGFAGLGSHRRQVFADELGHVGPRQMAPEVFHGIEFRCIRRQVFDGQPVRLTGDPALNLGSAMRRQSVPQPNHFATTHMPLQHLEVRQDLRLLDGSRLKSQTQTDSSGGGRGDQAGDRRQAFPIERGNEDRGLSAWRPGASHAGSFGKATFIQKNQQGSRQSSLF